MTDTPPSDGLPASGDSVDNPVPPGADGAAADAEPVEGRPTRRATWLAMGAVAVALGLIWLAPGIGDVHPEDSAEDGSVLEYPGEPDDHEATGKPAPLHFTLKDMNGADVTLASFKGKVILLNFWATWCGPCKAEIPSLVELQQQYGDDLVVLGYSVDDPPEKMRPYAAQYKINYPLLVGNGREDIQNAYGVLGVVPVSVIIGRDGKIAKKHSGIATKAQFEREIKALL
jgi:thiol-disulfide isomerase/thioredoxin